MSNETLLALVSGLANLSKKCTDKEVKEKITNCIDEINEIVIARTSH